MVLDLEVREDQSTPSNKIAVSNAGIYASPWPNAVSPSRDEFLSRSQALLASYLHEFEFLQRASTPAAEMRCRSFSISRARFSRAQKYYAINHRS
jgi:hypothetical protein